MKIFENVHLTTTTSVKRTWRERLWSWPWRPWRGYNVEHRPDPNLYKMYDSFGNEVIVGHPVAVAKLRELIAKQKCGTQCSE